MFCAKVGHLIHHYRGPPSPRGKALDSRGRIAKAGKFCKQNVACPYKKESKNLTATHIIHCAANSRLALWVIPHKSGEMSAMQTKGTARPRLPTETGERVRQTPIYLLFLFFSFLFRSDTEIFLIFKTLLTKDIFVL